MHKRYLSEFVYGAVDGTVTTFAIIAGSLGAALSPNIVLVLGLANVLADAFSMASSNYLAESAEQDLQPEHSGHDHVKSPKATAFVTFVSFVLVGLIPLLSFILELIWPRIGSYVFVISIILTGLTFLVIGYIRGRVTKKNPWRAAIMTLVIGGGAAAIAFVVGYLLRGLT